MPKPSLVQEVLDLTADAKLGKRLAKTFKQGVRDLDNGKEPFSWDCTPAIGSDGTIFVQAYGLHALK